MSVFQWPEAIAQYQVGHDRRLATIRTQLGAMPGLHVCGTSYDGVSFNHAIKSGRTTARAIAASLWHERGLDAAHVSSIPSAKAG
jgi:protoporphyrinogen oxidase